MQRNFKIFPNPTDPAENKILKNWSQNSDTKKIYCHLCQSQGEYNDLVYVEHDLYFLLSLFLIFILIYMYSIVGELFAYKT